LFLVNVLNLDPHFQEETIHTVSQSDHCSICFCIRIIKIHKEAWETLWWICSTPGNGNQ